MSESGIQTCVLGIDAGGTRIRARLCDARTGAVLGEGAGGPGNALSVPHADLVRNLVSAVRGAVPHGRAGALVSVVAGFAGGGPGGGAEKAGSALAAALAEVGADPAGVEVGGDADIAFATGPGAPADGLVLIAGTGAPD
ncbi:ATPase, partial [Streptomyces sp. NPDC047971]